MILNLVVFVAIAGAEPGDVDKTFSEVTLDRGRYVIPGMEGTLWFAGKRHEILHLSPHGLALNRYRYPDLRNPLPHPKGGVFFQATLEEGERGRWPARHGTVWIQSGREVVMTEDLLPGFDFREVQILHVENGPDKTIVVHRAIRGGMITLVYCSAVDGTVLSEFELERRPPGSESFVFLDDGRFLHASYFGLQRHLADGKRDGTYNSTISIGSEGASFAKRPDGRIILAIEDGRVGQLRADEDDDHFILVRLTKHGDLDDSFPGVVVPGDPRSIAATNAWTFYAGYQPRSDESVHRVDSGEAPPVVIDLRTAAKGEIIETNGSQWGKGSFCALERGDEFDDLIAAEWGPSRGPLQLINSKDPTKAWEHVRIDDEGQERPTRRLAVGNLDGDGFQDLVEWRLPTQADGKISVHWYRGVESDRGRTLRYASKLMLADLPPKLAVADVRLADIDGDGDDDLIARLATHFGNYWETTLKLEKDMPLEPPSLKWWRNDGVEKPWPGTAINKPGDFAGAPLIVVDDDGMPASHLHVRDLDNDGDPDIATVVLSQKVASQWFENVGGRYEERMTSIQVISDTERAVMPGFDPWLGGMMTRADVNGDGTPDRILAFPGYEPEDFDDDRRWARGVRWERGGGLPR